MDRDARILQLGRWIVVAWIGLIVLIVAMGAAQAQPLVQPLVQEIPSQASGDYVGDGWVCRLEAGRIPIAGHQPPMAPVSMRWSCVDPAGVQRIAQVSGGLYACPLAGTDTNWVAELRVAAAPHAPTGLMLSVEVIGLGQLGVRIGGQLMQWDRVQEWAPPLPYPGCGAWQAAPALGRR